jgi:hypothetical protein
MNFFTVSVQIQIQRRVSRRFPAYPYIKACASVVKRTSFPGFWRPAYQILKAKPQGPGVNVEVRRDEVEGSLQRHEGLEWFLPRLLAVPAFYPHPDHWFRRKLQENSQKFDLAKPTCPRPAGKAVSTAGRPA